MTPTAAEIALVLGASDSARETLRSVDGPGWVVTGGVDHDGEPATGTVLMEVCPRELCSGCLAPRDAHDHFAGEPSYERVVDGDGRTEPERCGEWVVPAWLPVDPCAIAAKAAEIAKVPAWSVITDGKGVIVEIGPEELLAEGGYRYEAGAAPATPRECALRLLAGVIG